MRHKAASSLAQGIDPGAMLAPGRPHKFTKKRRKHRRGKKRWTQKKLACREARQDIPKSSASAPISQIKTGELCNVQSGLRPGDTERNGSSLNKTTRLIRLRRGNRALSTPTHKLGRRDTYRPRWKSGGRVIKKASKPAASPAEISPETPRV